MGCDIHVRAEMLVDREGGQEWVPVPNPAVQCYCRGTGTSITANDGLCPLCTVPSWASGGVDDAYEGEGYGIRPYLSRPGYIYGEWYEGRNYRVFSVLADVRNSLGIIPISEPRGVPVDVSPQNRQWMVSGDHSVTWITLQEIMQYPWSSVQLWDDDEQAPGKWYDNFLFQMKRLVKVTGEHPARLIMWFDN